MHASESISIAVERPAPKSLTHYGIRFVVFGIIYYLLWISYGLQTWWKFLPTTLAATLLLAGLFGKRTDEMLGLRIGPAAAIASIALTAIFYLSAVATIPLALAGSDVEYAHFGFTGFSFLLTPFQVLNEEMLLRAAFMYFLSRFTKSVIGLSTAVGCAFALLHVVLHGVMDGYVLAWSTVLCLAAFGTVSNIVFLRTGHIGYTFAFHAGWNFARFSNGEFFNKNSGDLLNQPQSFDALEGSSLVAIASCTVLCLTIYSVYRSMRAPAARAS